MALADKYGLREHTRFGTEVEALWWDEDREQWQIHSVDRDGNRDVSYARVVITAAGYLNRPRWPDLPGRDTFAGTSIHSAQWDPSLDLTGKRVAIIGAGCTAVQIVDACVDEVEHLTVFQRQPHWVAPRKRLTDDVPEHRRYLGRHLPYYANWHRLKSYWAHRGQQLSGHPAGPRVGEGPPVDLARQRRAAADVPGVHRPDVRCRNGIGEEGDPGLRAVRQAHHPRSRRLLRGADARARRRGGQRAGRGQRERDRHRRTAGRSTSTSSSTRPDTTWTSCRRSTSAAATARSWPTSGATVRAPTGAARFLDFRICSSTPPPTTAPDTVRERTSRWR